MEARAAQICSLLEDVALLEDSSATGPLSLTGGGAIVAGQWVAPGWPLNGLVGE